jgi:hypothetical protein
LATIGAIYQPTRPDLFFNYLKGLPLSPEIWLGWPEAQIMAAYLAAQARASGGHPLLSYERIRDALEIGQSIIRVV